MTKEKSKRQKNYFSEHLILDLYDCLSNTVGDLQKCYLFLDDLATMLKAEKLSPPFIVFTDEKKYPDKAGLSGWIPLFDPETNRYFGSSIHTLTPTNFISIDIYCCPKNSSSYKTTVKKFVLNTFKPKRVEEKHFLRGENYSVKK